MSIFRFFVFILFVFSKDVSSGDYMGVVTRIIDGDSLVVQHEDNSYKLRLRYIDAPEISQDYGNKSKNFLGNLILHKSILVSTEYNDRYGRQLADIYIHNDKESIYINAKMIKSGNAWVYRKYRSNTYLMNLENHARINNKGLWISRNPIEPCLFRNKCK